MPEPFRFQNICGASCNRNDSDHSPRIIFYDKVSYLDCPPIRNGKIEKFADGMFSRPHCRNSVALSLFPIIFLEV